MSLVVVGASLAGLRAVEAARKAGYDGRVVLVGAEEHLPYDRPPLSKAFLAAGPEPEPPSYRSADELAALDVELRLGSPATGLDPAAREVVLGEERLPYDAVVLATGARPRRLPGDDLDGVHVLRTLDDARAVRAALDIGARTVVVGAGFIGSEVASAARERGLPVTVVEAAPAPLLRAVGPQAAPLCAALHARAGADLRCGAGVEAFEHEGRRVTGVRLSDGTRLPADLVVVGAGCTPVTDWLAGSGLVLDHGVVCDRTLRASAPGVLAAGDVARVDGIRLEHWTSAAEQGARAGANAVALLTGGTLLPYDAVPYFWSDAYGSKLQMVGRPSDEPAEVVGDPAGPWLVLYRRGDRLAGVLSLDLPGRIMKFRALLAREAPFEEGLELARSRPLVAVA
jgi:NADPH-dependent 2,4-dienoyl-CoA reductase/sulfur reductase-like enzyme